MSRTALPDLPSRQPLGDMLPAMYAADDFAQRWTSGLDTVLAAILSTMDNLPAYLDARLAPEDFLDWLASWIAAELDRGWPAELRRTVVRHAVELHRWQGTVRGLVARLGLCLGVGAEVSGGAATWSSTPDTALPGEPVTSVVVRVWAESGGDVPLAQVTAMVDAVCPAHLTCRVEVLPGPPAQEGA